MAMEFSQTICITKPRKLFRVHTTEQDLHVSSISKGSSGPFVCIYHSARPPPHCIWTEFPNSLRAQLNQFVEEVHQIPDDRTLFAYTGSIHSALKCASGIGPWQAASFNVEKGVDSHRGYECYRVKLTIADSHDNILGCALSYEAEENKWLKRIQVAVSIDCEGSTLTNHNDEKVEDYSLSKRDKSKQYMNLNTEEYLAPKKIVPNLRQVAWDGCTTTLFVRLAPGCRCTDRRETWAWPYIAPHPRIVPFVSTAGPNLIFFNGGVTAPIADVRLWLQTDASCCQLSIAEFQHLCFSVTLQVP